MLKDVVRAFGTAGMAFDAVTKVLLDPDAETDDLKGASFDAVGDVRFREECVLRARDAAVGAVMCEDEEDTLIFLRGGAEIEDERAAAPPFASAAAWARASDEAVGA